MNRKWIKSSAALLTLAGLTVSVSAQLVFFDNYETTPTGVTVGNPPPNPPYVISSTNASNNARVESGVAFSGPNALHVVDTTNVLIVGARRNFVETNIMPKGLLTFNLRLDDVSVNNAMSLELLAPNLLNFSIPQRAVNLEFFRIGSPSGNVTFRLQTAGFPVFTNSFPLASFQQISIGWNNGNLGSNGTYFVTWNGITNSAKPNFTFTNITGFQVSGNSSTLSTYNAYLDNMILEVPEPGALALMVLGVGTLAMIRKNRRS